MKQMMGYGRCAGAILGGGDQGSDIGVEMQVWLM